MEKQENAFTAMLQNLKWLPVSSPSHSKTLFSDFQASLTGSVLPLQQHLLLHLSTNPLVRALKPFRCCHTLLDALPASLKPQRVPSPQKGKKKEAAAAFFYCSYSNCPVFLRSYLYKLLNRIANERYHSTP